MSVPLNENHELHGALLGVAVCVVLKVGGRSIGESLAAGTMAGALGTAAMKTFGHPDILSSMLPS
jgi:hypothetical protein